MASSNNNPEDDEYGRQSKLHSAPAFKLEKLPKLTGPENWQAWSDMAEYVLSTCGCWEIVTGSETEPPAPKPDSKDTDIAEKYTGYHDRLQYTKLFFLSCVDTTWISILTVNKTPNKIWKALEDKFARENTVTFYNQLTSLLNTKLGSKAQIADHLTSFDTNWTRLQHRCSSAKDSDNFKLPTAFKSVFDSLEAKAALLLYSLPSSMENVVDNLQTKPDLTYDQAYQRLMDLSTTSATDKDDKAYNTGTGNPPRNRNNTTENGQKECTYCKKHYPKSRFTGHTWNDCNKLKADKEKKESGKSAESAKVSTETPSAESETVRLSTDIPAPPSNPSSRWVIDTGASSHMSNNLDLFMNFRHSVGNVRVADDRTIRSWGTGDIALWVKLPNGSSKRVVLQNVLYVPQLGSSNLLSWKAASVLGYFMDGHHDGLFVRTSKDGPVILWGKLNGTDYVLQVKEHAARLTSYSEWHHAFCHASTQYVKPSIYKDGHLVPPPPKDFHCTPCALAKSSHKVPPPVINRSKRPFELIHSDLSGRFSKPSFGKSEYYITLIDDYTRFTWVFFLQKKNDANGVIIRWIKEQKTRGNVVLRWRNDGGGEYINDELDSFFGSEGIKQEVTPPYSHESNGVAERYNRSLITLVRALIQGLAFGLWAEAVATTVYIKNRLPTKGCQAPTPYEALHGEQPTVQHLQPFGRKCYVHIPEEKRPAGTKLLPRALEGTFVGYTDSTRIFRIYIPSQHKIVITRDLRFAPINSGEVIKQPAAPPPITSNDSDDESTTAPPPRRSSRLRHRNLPQPEPTSDTISESESDSIDSGAEQLRREQAESDSPPPEPVQQLEVIVPSPPDNREEYSSVPGTFPDETPEPRRSGRSHQQPDRYSQHGWARFADEILDSINTEPKTFKQAIASPDGKLWQKAMDEELAALKRNNTFTVVPRPTGKSIIGCKWVYKIKRNADGSVERYKARGVARGFTQIPGEDYDEIFAPVVRYESLRLLLALCAHFGWTARQLDVKSAFLYGILSEEIYMHPLPGYEKDGMVWKLGRCLYGLKQSANKWYERLASSLCSKGFQISSFDPCVFVHRNGRMFLSIYVDDIAIYAADTPEVNTLIASLKAEFDITDLGQATWLLGLHITYTSDGINVSQEQYIDKVLKKFGMESSRPVSTPLDKGNKLRKGSEADRIDDPAYYQAIIGSLMYAVTGTRPDLAHTISCLSQFNSCPTAEHLAAAKHTLRYVNKTKSWSLFYPAKQPLKLEGFTDADYASCLDTRRSFSGYVFRLGRSVISWKSRKQDSVSVSTVESEYVALSLATRQIQWFQKAFCDFKLRVPCAIFCDNTGTISLSQNDQLNDRTKHIDVHYHKAREELARGTFYLFHVPTSDNLADICTKTLPKPQHMKLAELIRCAQ